MTGNVIITNDLTITGNIYISGNTTSISANNLIINDPLLYLANNNPANLNDIGVVGHFVSDRYQHTGIVRDHNDGKWKFFSNVTSEPTNTVTFDQNTIYDTLKVGTIEASSANIGNVDLLSYAQATNNSLSSNIAYIAGVDTSQNTNISNLQTWLDSNVSLQSGINSTQNTNITNVTTWLNSNVTLQSGINTTQNTNITNVTTWLDSNVSYIAGVNVTQNTNISNIQSQLDSNVTLQSGINTTQNTNISNLQTWLNSNVTLQSGINTTQNTNISNIQSQLDSNVSYIAGVNSSQNTSITNATNLAQAAFDKANTGGTGSSSGYLASSVIYANTLGYLSNTSNLQYFSSNNTLVVANIRVPTIYTTSSGIVFPDGTSQSTAAGGAAVDQTARNIANTKVYAFFQNTAPSSANSHDLWMQCDTGVVYENWGTPSSPVWAEFGPTGVAPNTSPGVFAATQANVYTSLFVGGLTPLGGATNPIIGAIGNTNNYIQTYIWNSSNTSNSSSDFVAYSSNGNDVSGWVDMGITSNAYNQSTYSVTGRNEGYLFMSAPSGSGASGNLVIATDSTGVYNSIEFVTGGFGKGKGNNAVTIRNNDLIVTGNTSFNGIGGGYAPNRPAFRVYGANTTNNLTTTQNGTGALTANNWSLDFAQGNYLNQTSGVFTAPVAGRYQINIVVRNSGYASGIMQAAVVKNATGGNGSGGSVVVMVEFAASSTMNHAGGSAVVKMSVNDTLVLKVLAGQINFDFNDNWSVAYIG